MKWRKPETRREKRERIQEEKSAPSRARDALTAEQERFVLWCEEAENIIRNNPRKALAQEKARQLLLAAQHKHEDASNTGAESGPENGWKTENSYENWHRAGRAGYHYIRSCFPGLHSALDLLTTAQPGDIAPLVDYLEASPRFYGSGYLAEMCIGHVRRAQLTSGQRRSLQAAVLKAVDNQDRFRIKAYRRLARVVDSLELRGLLQTRLGYDDPIVRRRAGIMLHSLAEKDAGR